MVMLSIEQKTKLVSYYLTTGSIFAIQRKFKLFSTANTPLHQKQFYDKISSLLGKDLSLIKAKVGVEKNLQKEQRLSEKWSPALLQGVHRSARGMSLNLT